MATTLLRCITALTHDDIDVSFQNHGYNSNMLILSRRSGGEVTIRMEVALPDDHLNDEKLVQYLLLLEQALLEAESKENEG